MALFRFARVLLSRRYDYRPKKYFSRIRKAVALPGLFPVEFVSFWRNLLTLRFPLQHLPTYEEGKGEQRMAGEAQQDSPSCLPLPISFFSFLLVKSIISKPLETRRFA